ncbi:FAD-dependent monooxygenase [Pseudonocardia spinosispora]|uniref:FAD-dependent monooxygenase n=1 Tax=Pseudonocardia spinosispora TaxID=103441 RepID=UPI000409C29B|nr:FAD-dependent monooxygenase [Pseudonocardia spinosispora]
MDSDVVVVGGGIGGLGCALALRRAGLRVRVLEQDSQFGEVGAGLQVAPNATRILRSWGLLDDVVARGVRPRRLVLRDALDGAELTHLDAADLARRYGAPYILIHRGDLHSILLGACRDTGVELCTSVQVTGVEQEPARAVAISSDRRDAASVVLAADGLGSGLRSLLNTDHLVSSGYVAYRGTVPVAELTETDGVTLDEMVIYIGPDCHLVQYPLRGGELLNQAAVFRSPKALAGEIEWGTPDELDAAFRHTCDAVRAGLPRLWRNRWWRMYDREPIGTWVDRRLALVGDAAHPMLQYLAQGACQALEDADCLAGALGSTTDLDAALRTYDELRTVRTARVQRTARDWGKLWHCDGVSRAARNALLTDRTATDYRYIDWLYSA